MMKRSEQKIIRAFVLGVFLCSGRFSVEASELFSTADTMEAGAWTFSVYGKTADSEPELELSSVSGISVPTSGGSSTIFGNTNADITLEQRTEQILSMVEFQPRNGLKYRFKVGQVRDFDLQYSSGSQTNKLESTGDGLVWGLGIGGSFAPGSIVSTGIRWDLAYTQTNVTLDRLQGGTQVYAVNEKFRQEEYQGSVTFSRRIKMFEPYAGLKVFHFVSRLTDNDTKEKIKGEVNDVSPFIGLQWSLADRESIVIEGSFVGEESLSAGFKVQF